MIDKENAGPEYAEALEAAGFDLFEWEDMYYRQKADPYDYYARERFDELTKILEKV